MLSPRSDAKTRKPPRARGFRRKPGRPTGFPCLAAGRPNRHNSRVIRLKSLHESSTAPRCRKGRQELERFARGALRGSAPTSAIRPFRRIRELLSTNPGCQPQHADSFHLLGLISVETKKYDQAIEFIAQAIRCDPNNPDYLSNLGIALQRLAGWTRRSRVTTWRCQ